MSMLLYSCLCNIVEIIVGHQLINVWRHTIVKLVKDYHLSVDTGVEGSLFADANTLFIEEGVLLKLVNFVVSQISDILIYNQAEGKSHSLMLVSQC